MGASNLVSLIGLLSLTGIAYLLSENKKSIDRSIIWKALLIQIIFALLVLGVPAYDIPGPLRFVFNAANDFILAVLGFSEKGGKFIFGDMADSQKFGFIFAFQVLPTIIFMSSLMAVMYHLGLMQKIVNALARFMHKTLKVSGAESLSTAANIFVGQTEAPLVVRPFLSKMTKSELFCIMVGGMANTAGGVLAAYVGLLKGSIPDIAGHLLTASVLSAPAALLAAKLMIPETETPETLVRVPTEYEKEKIDSNAIEAAARGASEGLLLALNVAAMLIAFIALVALVDATLGWFGEMIHFSAWGHDLVPELIRQGQPATLSAALIFGWLFAPLAWIMGVPWSECAVAGSLLGQKIVLNEFVAYLNLSTIMSQLSERTVIIMSYALCGFANFSSIGIQIGGIGAMAPERRGDLAKLGIRAIIGGSIASFMCAAVAGILIR
jgi:concentrative nucleoside transporter, CNT family